LTFINSGLTYRLIQYLEDDLKILWKGSINLNV